MAKLAKDHGWTPLDIPEPMSPPQTDAPEWEGPAPDQPQQLPPGTVLKISDLDAQRLADALESALPDIPRFDALAEKTLYQLDLPTTFPVRVLNPGSKVSGYEYFSGPNRPALERFIGLCRGGELTVS